MTLLSGGTKKKKNNYTNYNWNYKGSIYKKIKTKLKSITEAKIEEIEQYHQKGAMGRSRTKLIENEEKPTKFFYTAEKQNKNKKI